MREERGAYTLCASRMRVQGTVRQNLLSIASNVTRVTKRFGCLSCPRLHPPIRAWTVGFAIRNITSVSCSYTAPDEIAAGRGIGDDFTKEMVARRTHILVRN